MNVEIKLLRPGVLSEGKMPSYATKGSAAIDLTACLDTSELVYPGQCKLIHTGISIHIADPGFAAMILPRSGLGSKGIVIGNLVGLIDSDYQGELMISVWNRNLPTGNDSEYDAFRINNGDRIAQLVVVPVVQMNLILVDEFSALTDRGAGGFGSTGR